MVEENELKLRQSCVKLHLQLLIWCFIFISFGLGFFFGVIYFTLLGNVAGVLVCIRSLILN